MSGVLPARSYAQQELTDMFAAVLDDPKREPLLRRLHESSRVQRRHLALPIDQYPKLGGFGDANARFVEVGVDLAERAVLDALGQAGLEPSDVDVIVSTTVTGVAAPSLEARLANRIPLRSDVKRMPLFGLGCVAGAAGVARLHDLLRGDPDGVAVLLSVELCSLTMQRDDGSTANLVASGLFGDGAAAVVAVGDRRAEQLGLAGPSVLATRSHLYPDTEQTMGWDVTATGFRIVLDSNVPALAERFLPADAAGLLEPYGLTTADVATWICHPGGPKVIDAIQSALDLPADALELTWRSLTGVGNLSSSSVLHVFADTIAKRPAPGSYGVLMAMGPGFCSELVLLQW